MGASEIRTTNHTATACCCGLKSTISMLPQTAPPNSKAQVVLPKHRNPPDGNGGPNHWEIWLRDPDGYTVVLASPDGSAAS